MGAAEKVAKFSDLPGCLDSVERFRGYANREKDAGKNERELGLVWTKGIAWPVWKKGDGVVEGKRMIGGLVLAGVRSGYS